MTQMYWFGVNMVWMCQIGVFGGIYLFLLFLISLILFAKNHLLKEIYRLLLIKNAHISKVKLRTKGRVEDERNSTLKRRNG